MDKINDLLKTAQDDIGNILDKNPHHAMIHAIFNHIRSARGLIPFIHLDADNKAIVPKDALGDSPTHPAN